MSDCICTSCDFICDPSVCNCLDYGCNCNDCTCSLLCCHSCLSFLLECFKCSENKPVASNESTEPKSSTLSNTPIVNQPLPETDQNNKNSVLPNAAAGEEKPPID
ncbi:hypothetical protein FQR65_LT03030 [Abscondita terminalis]|nr:hypothetical protein FQR65_LT03030 [Abscondita terminalis]